MSRRRPTEAIPIENPSPPDSRQPPAFANTILKSLRPPEFANIGNFLEGVRLQKNQVLSSAGETAEHVYFPEGGIISFTIPMPISGQAEFGIIGHDGLSSFSALFEGKPSPVDTMVQVGDASAYRIRSSDLRVAYQNSEQLRTLIVEHLYRFMSQMAYTAVSNARHTLPQRLSRWLLMSHDRLDGDDIPLTHEFLAMMLGSQRTSVTSTLHVLEGHHAIYSHRGIVKVRSRERLEDCAGEAYDLSGSGNPIPPGRPTGGV